MPGLQPVLVDLWRAEQHAEQDRGYRIETADPEPEANTWDRYQAVT
jgi:hypothetical protein